MPQFVTVEADDSVAPPRIQAFDGDPAIDPRKVILVNFSDAHYRLSVADGSDDQLAEQLKSSLATIASLANEHGHKWFEPGEDGLAPKSLHDKMEMRDARGRKLSDIGSYRVEYSNLVSAERRVKAIRAEQSRREEARKAAAAQKVEDERAKHEAVLATAKEKAAGLIAEMNSAADALKAIDALAAAVCVAVHSRKLGGDYINHRLRVEEAALALGVELPSLPEAPPVPTSAAQDLYGALQFLGMARGPQGMG
jgi:hypothetical protein